jgi:hypothetical protein
LHYNTNNILNKKFGRLTVIDITDRRSPRGEIYWLCRCDCGNNKIIKGTHLTRIKKGIKSCGCLPKEVGMKNIKFGKDNYFWKGGITKSYSDRLQKSHEIQRWRKKIFKRDKYTCQYCHQIGKELNAHHIKSWMLYPDLRFDLDNGITLCKSCHIYVHNINVLSQN